MWEPLVSRKKGAVSKEAYEKRGEFVMAYADSLGRAPTGNEIINTAMAGRAVVQGPHPDSTSAENGTARKRTTSDSARRSGTAESGASESGAGNG